MHKLKNHEILLSSPFTCELLTLREGGGKQLRGPDDHMGPSEARLPGQQCVGGVQQVLCVCAHVYVYACVVCAHTHMSTFCASAMVLSVYLCDGTYLSLCVCECTCKSHP